MCGIIGIISDKPVRDRLVTGLQRLEYRGYDSAGIATLEGDKIERARATGKIVNLEQTVKNSNQTGTVGIAHTRWATHGKPSITNAHPHTSRNVTLVHNGIIENYQDLRANLIKEGFTFEGDTDSETVAHLIAQHKATAPEKSNLEVLLYIRDALKGAYALVVMFEDEPDVLYGLRMASPLVLGANDNNECFFGSDTLALDGMISSVIYLEDGDLAVIKQGYSTIYDRSGIQAIRSEHHVQAQSDTISKGPYAHFMLKEIHEQPDAVRRTITNLVSADHREITLGVDPQLLSDATQIRIIACGTSYYAGLTAKSWLESIAHVPTHLEIASEFRYHTPPLPEGTLCIFISQSGETADTLAALKLCKERDLRTIGIVNVPGSSIAREVDVILQTKAGPEIGVASTKAFTAQLTVLATLTLELARIKKTLTESEYQAHIKGLMELPPLLEKSSAMAQSIDTIAQDLSAAESALFIGRGGSFPIALEGALKLKEISYIHAEAYAGGELKHGPIALIDAKTPTIAIVPHDNIFEKMVSNIEEIKARNGTVIAVTDTQGAFKLQSIADACIIMPPSSPLLTPFVMTLPVQLLAYYVALKRGTDVDQPRNLAKSVTVE